MAPFSLYDRMKTMFLRGLLIVVLCVGCAESQRGEFVPQSEEFKAFLEKFPEQKTPIYNAADAPIEILGTDSMTEYEGDMWERFLSDAETNQFVKGKIPMTINPEALCYLGCMAGARVKSRLLQTNKFVMLIINKGSDAGCGEEEFLVIYDENGEVTDYLVIYGNYSKNDIPSLKTANMYTPYSIFSKIEDDSIIILEKKYYFHMENGETKRYEIVYTKRNYVVSDKGKFVMTSEEEEVTEKKE